MKVLGSTLVLPVLMLLSGCSSDSAAGSKNAAIDCAVEIQVAVVTGLKPEYEMKDGDWHIAATCVLPVQSTGGPGQAACNSNGAIVELRWSDVHMIDGGNAIVFDGCHWEIKNPIDRGQGSRHQLRGGASNEKLRCSTDYDWLSSVTMSSTSSKPSEPKLVVRRRLLLKPTPVEPIDLKKLTGITG